MNRWAKAVTAGLVAGATVYELVTLTSSAAGEAVTGNEWARVVVSVLVAGLAVWAVPNAPDTSRRQP